MLIAQDFRSDIQYPAQTLYRVSLAFFVLPDRGGDFSSRVRVVPEESVNIIYLAKAIRSSTFTIFFVCLRTPSN